MTIRIGIVGTGLMAGNRAREFNPLAETEVAAVCSRSRDKAETIAREVGATATDDYAGMLGDVDAVVICLPNAFHMQYVREALDAGCHVLVEYPLCTSMDDAAALTSLAAKTGKVLMVGNTIIHEAMFAHLEAGRARLGPLLSAASRMSFYGETMAGSWYLSCDLLGPMFAGLHYHHIEYYRHFLGEVAWVLGRDESVPDPEDPDRFQTRGGTLLMGHQGGGTSCFQLYVGAEGDGTSRGLWLNGTTASVTVVSTQPDRSRVIWYDGGESRTEEYDDEWGVAGSCKDFMAAIRGELDHAERLVWDARTMAIGIAASESARTGQIVRVD